MRNLFLLTCLSMFSLSFGQSKDLTKKQAYEAFKNSVIRKRDHIPLSKFEFYYKQAKCVKENYGDKDNYPNSTLLRKMPIFNNKTKDEGGNGSIFSYYGYYLDLPKKDDFGNKTTCL